MSEKLASGLMFRGVSSKSQVYNIVSYYDIFICFFQLFYDFRANYSKYLSVNVCIFTLQMKPGQVAACLGMSAFSY